MKVGLIGYGFVGKALANGFKSSVSILKIDPKLGNSVEDLVSFKPDIVFVCVPTPLNKDLTLDASIVNSVMEEIINYKINSLIVLKSTILPNFIEIIDKKIERFIYNPEFLREKHANEDFINSNLIVFGGRQEEISKLSNFYSNYTNCVCQDYIETDIFTASLIKYTINSFLAIKVTFFNELKQIFNKSETSDSWEKFILYLQRDSRLGNSHMSVPGHDGKEGFGGACLPKDSISLSNFFKQKNLDFKVLETAISVNNTIRGKYNDDPREIEQKINFKNST